MKASRLIALAASVGALALAPAFALAQSNLPPVGVPPQAPYIAYKDSRTSYPQGHIYGTIQATFSTVSTGTFSPYIQCIGGTVEVQFGGAGTALSGQLERSDSNPAVVSNPQPVGSAQSGVDPATGVAPVTATEGAVGWWAYDATSSTGAVTVSLSCTQG